MIDGAAGTRRWTARRKHCAAAWEGQHTDGVVDQDCKDNDDAAGCGASPTCREGRPEGRTCRRVGDERDDEGDPSVIRGM